MFVKVLACCVFVIILISLDGCDGAPRPCPQFLPVAVRMDNIRTPYRLKTVVKVKDEKENLISEDLEKPLHVSPSDLLLPEVRKNPVGDSNEIKPINKIRKEKPNEPKLLQISEISNENLENTKRPGTQKLTKRRRSRPKESRRIILSQNTNFALKTINDKPAEEVLLTDKASVARDLKDSTESALVSVRKLEV